jgi:hypothetical protein
MLHHKPKNYFFKDLKSHDKNTWLQGLRRKFWDRHYEPYDGEYASSATIIPPGIDFFAQIRTTLTHHVTH